MEVKISQDIRKYKTKDIGNFSFREAGYIAIGAGLAVLTYTLTGSFEIAIAPMGVVCVLAFFKPFGLSFIQFIRTFIKERVTTQVYINETDFEYDPNEFDELYGEEIAIPAEWNDVIQTSDTAPVIDKADLPNIFS